MDDTKTTCRERVGCFSATRLQAVEELEVGL